MRLFIFIFATLLTTQLSAEIYSWKDENGVTHFSETKPSKATNEVETISVKKDPESEFVAEQKAEKSKKASNDKLSKDFLVGRWLGYSESSKKKQEWVFKDDGFFSIKQILNVKSDLMYTGQWELDYEDIMLSIAFKAETNNGEKSSGFVSIQNSAEVFEYKPNRILVNFNEEEFWLERN